MTVLQLRSGSSAEAQGVERHSRASATRNRRRFSQNICGNGLVRTFPVTGLIIGAVAAVLIAWRFQKHDTNEPKWRVTTSTLGLLLVTLSVFLFFDVQDLQRPDWWGGEWKLDHLAFNKNCELRFIAGPTCEPNSN
jgi:hypothetical protein